MKDEIERERDAYLVAVAELDAEVKSFVIARAEEAGCFRDGRGVRGTEEFIGDEAGGFAGGKERD